MYTKLLHCALLLATQTGYAKILTIKNNDHFMQEISDKKQPAVVKFYATWCGPCQLSKEPFLKVSNDPKFSHIIFAEVDTDQNRTLSTKFAIEALPTFIFMTGSSIHDKAVGLLGAFTAEDFEHKLESTLQQLFPLEVQTIEPPFEDPIQEKTNDDVWQNSTTLATKIINKFKQFFESMGSAIQNLFR